MKINKDLKGRKVRKPWWPKGDWYRLLFVGNFVVVAKDQNGLEVTFDIDFTDKDWEPIPEEPKDDPDDGSPSTTTNGKVH